eukprot:TRINITY_DN15966_c0_g1_i5.p1 TRINITY_DN15966_c0_g1~~TRINITY_DN15966_c0_g1_i5.p1  ORF type:complete len:1071 (-),score=143.44 TRINITY_DN15966_c0_g1_i5:198-3023(-)
MRSIVGSAPQKIVASVSCPGCYGGCAASGGCWASGCSASGCKASGCSASGCKATGCSASGCKASGCSASGCKASGCSATGCTATGCSAAGCSASGCSATGCKASGCSASNATGCSASACTAKGCSASGCAAGTGRRLRAQRSNSSARSRRGRFLTSSSATIKFTIQPPPGGDTSGVLADLAANCSTPTQFAAALDGAIAAAVAAARPGAVAAKARLANFAVDEVSAAKVVTSAPKQCPRGCGGCGGGCGGCGGCSVVEIFNPCAGAFSTTCEEPPEYYTRYKPFSMITAMMGQPLICQVRRKAMECPSQFVNDYNNQRINALYLPPLNAPRNDSILRCKSPEYERGKHLGYLPTIQNGLPEYCVFLSPETLAPMKEFEWIDDMTEKVTVSTLIFTPDVATLTLASVRFDFSATGRVRGHYDSKTHAALIESDRFEVWRAIAISFLVCLVYRLITLVVNLKLTPDTIAESAMRRMLRFDIVFTLFWIAFAIYSIVRKHADQSLLGYIMPLLNCFLGVADTSDTNAVQETINVYFEAMGKMQEQVYIEDITKTVAYISIVFGILRLVAYMAVHPRIDVISRTLVNAADDTFHFLVVFSFMFFAFAWLGHWSFGPDKEDFQTYPIAINTCFQMLIGDFPFGDEWTEGVFQKIWYYLYTFLIFFVSVNILLAIIVEAFLRVKQVNEQNQAEINFVMDILALLVRQIGGCLQKWPSNQDVMLHLRVHGISQHDITPFELHNSKFLKFRNFAAANRFLRFYHHTLGDVILGVKGKQMLAQRLIEDEQALFVRKLFRVKAISEVNEILESVVKVQGVFRRNKARARIGRIIARKRARENAKEKLVVKRNDGTEIPLTIRAWTTTHVRSWIVNNQGLPLAVGKKMQEQDVDGTILPLLTDAHLKDDFGMMVLGQRLKLLQAIRILVERPAFPLLNEDVPEDFHLGLSAH